MYWRIVGLLAAGVVALVCSCVEGSQTSVEGDPTIPSLDGSASDGAEGQGDGAQRAADSAPATDDAGVAVQAGVGICASCTSQKCMATLSACAASSPCVNALLAFNDCFGKQTDGTSGACGPTFAAEGPDAKALWTCLATNCKAMCVGP